MNAFKKISFIVVIFLVLPYALSKAVTSGDDDVLKYINKKELSKTKKTKLKKIYNEILLINDATADETTDIIDNISMMLKKNYNLKFTAGVISNLVYFDNFATCTSSVSQEKLSGIYDKFYDAWENKRMISNRFRYIDDNASNPTNAAAYFCKILLEESLDAQFLEFDDPCQKVRDIAENIYETINDGVKFKGKPPKGSNLDCEIVKENIDVIYYGPLIDYGELSEEDKNYLLAVANENSSYNGFVAVAYSILNRAVNRDLKIKDIVTEKNQYRGYNEDTFNDLEKYRNMYPEVVRAINDIAEGKVMNPIGKCVYFYGVYSSNSPLWVEDIDECDEIYCVEKNVFFTDADYERVHNHEDFGDSIGIVKIYDGESWPHGKTFTVHRFKNDN